MKTFELKCDIKFDACDLYSAFFNLSKYFNSLYRDEDPDLEYTGNISLETVMGVSNVELNDKNGDEFSSNWSHHINRSLDE